MKAFNSDEQLRLGLIDEVIKHRLADQIIAGAYGEFNMENFQGCAVGCTLHSYGILQGRVIDTSDHSVYEEFGIPVVLARLQDRIFEGLPQELRITWPERFYKAISIGADLTGVWRKFAIWLLIDAEHGVIKYSSRPDCRSAIQRVAELYQSNGTKEQFRNARAAAYAAYIASADADAYAAYVAYAAAYAADVYAADAYAADAAYAARQKAYIAQSEKLLEFLREAE